MWIVSSLVSGDDECLDAEDPLADVAVISLGFSDSIVLSNPVCKSSVVIFLEFSSSRRVSSSRNTFCLATTVWLESTNFDLINWDKEEESRPDFLTSSSNDFPISNISSFHGLWSFNTLPQSNVRINNLAGQETSRNSSETRSLDA